MFLNVFMAVVLIVWGNIFADNTRVQPDAVVLYSSNTMGEYAAQGCASSFEGGFARRASAIQEVREEFPEVILIDGGSLLFNLEVLDDFIKEDQLKRASLISDVVGMMNYDGIGIGPNDLSNGVDFLRKIQLPWLATNLKLNGKGEAPLPKVRLIKKGKRGVAIVSVLSETRNGSIQLEDAISSIRSEDKDIPKGYIKILLTHGGPEFDDRLASALSFDFIIGENDSVFVGDVRQINQTNVIHIGRRGVYLGKLSIYSYPLDGTHRKLRDLSETSKTMDDIEWLRSELDGYAENVGLKAPYTWDQLRSAYQQKKMKGQGELSYYIDKFNSLQKKMKGLPKFDQPGFVSEVIPLTDEFEEDPEVVRKIATYAGVEGS